MSCDLHTHSTFSDGTCTPEEIVSAAEALGLTAVALCDHNDVEGLPRFLRAAEGKRTAAVPGTEITTVFEDAELHIVGLFVPESGYGAVRALTERMRRSKAESNLALERRLNAAGYPVHLSDISAAHPDAAINRAHFAAELMRLGYVSSITEAFKTLLAPGAGFYVPPERTDAFEAITLLRGIGAVPVLAHPLLKLDAAGLERFLPRAVECGLLAIETRYPLFDAADERTADAAAEKYGLMPSGGSDFHGENKPDIRLGTGRGALNVPDEWYEALREAAEKA